MIRNIGSCVLALSLLTFGTNASGQVALDFLGRYEALADDFAIAARRVGLPPGIRLPRLQSAPEIDPASFYTPELRDVVRNRYSQDVALFGYEFPSG